MVTTLHGEVCYSSEGLTDRILIPYFPHQLLKYLNYWNSLMILLTAEGLALWRHCCPAPCCESPGRVLWEASNQRIKTGAEGCKHKIIITSPCLGPLNEHSRSFVTQPQASKKAPNEFDAFLHGMAKQRGFSKFKEKCEKANGVKQLRWQLFLSLKRKCVQLFMFSLN